VKLDPNVFECVSAGESKCVLGAQSSTEGLQHNVMRIDLVPLPAAVSDEVSQDFTPQQEKPDGQTV
jgi:hypothetical protein